jgi:hypothetical protein
MTSQLCNHCGLFRFIRMLVRKIEFKHEKLTIKNQNLCAKLDLYGSVYHNINRIEMINNMRQCSRIYYSNVS